MIGFVLELERCCNKEVGEDEIKNARLLLISKSKVMTSACTGCPDVDMVAILFYSRSRKVGSNFKEEKFEKQNCACFAQIDDVYSLYHSANHIVVVWLCQPNNKATIYNDF